METVVIDRTIISRKSTQNKDDQVK